MLNNFLYPILMIMLMGGGCKGSQTNITRQSPPTGRVSLSSGVKVLSVSPSETGSDIQVVHGPHLALYDPAVPSLNKLILMLVGTGASAGGSRGMDSILATMGYHVISLDYKNNVIAVSCAHSKDSTCFDRYRKEIVTGTPVSSEVNVDSANSILHRFSALLSYLVTNDPGGDWDNFIVEGRPRWDSIITAGHSQGSGHAAYIAKMFKVNRVLMFSGPQDYLDDLDEPAPWQSKKGFTPGNCYFAFLSLKDPYNVNHQIANCAELLGVRHPDTLVVFPNVTIHDHAHILINDIITNNPHGSTLFPEFKNVWFYMLNKE